MSLPLRWMLVAGLAAIVTIAVLVLREEPVARPPVAAIEAPRRGQAHPMDIEPIAPEPPAPARVEHAVTDPLPAETDERSSSESIAPALRRIRGRVLRAADRSPLSRAPVRPALAGEGSRTRVSVSWGRDTQGGDGSKSISMSLTRDDAEGADPEAVLEAMMEALAGFGDGGLDVVLTEDDGTFVLRRVPQEATQIAVEAHGMWAEDPQLFDAPAGAGDVEELELVADTGFIVEGVVRDAFGQPVADVPVAVVPETSVERDDRSEHGSGLLELQTWADVNGPLRRATSDATGGFRLVDVVVDAHAATWQLGAFPGDDVAWIGDVDVPAGPSVIGPIEITLERGGRLAGRITDARGGPVSLGRIQLELATTSTHVKRLAFGQTTFSEKTGRYELAPVPAGTYLVSANRFGDGIPPRWIGGVEIVADQTTTLDVRLGDGAVLSGRVVDTDGYPVPDATVGWSHTLAWPARGATGSMISRLGELTAHTERDPATGAFGVRLTEPGATTTTDADGAWRLTHLPAGTHELRVTEAPQEYLPAPAVDVVVQEDDVELFHDIVLEHGLVLSGRVVDASGLPIEDARAVAHVADGSIRLWDPDDDTSTNAAGEFALPGRPDEPHVLWVTHPLYVDHWAEDVAPDAALEVELVLAATLRVQVVEAGTQQRIEDVRVTITGPDGASREQQFSDGLVELRFPSEDPIRLRFEADGYAPHTLGAAVPSYATTCDGRADLNTVSLRRREGR